MIGVDYSASCRDLMDEFGITEDEMQETINERHRGLVDYGMTRIAAVHWFSDERIIFVESIVTERFHDKKANQMHFKSTCAHIALELRPILRKRRRIDREMNMELILANIAESFGLPIKCHPDEPYSTLYSGRCVFGPNNELWFDVKRPGGRDIGIIGSFQPESRWVDLAWALDLRAYRKWHGENIGRSG